LAERIFPSTDVVFIRSGLKVEFGRRPWILLGWTLRDTVALIEEVVALASCAEFIGAFQAICRTLTASSFPRFITFWVLLETGEIEEDIVLITFEASNCV
jgi:hypothetical protein